MTVPLRHKHSEQHRGVVPEDQLGATAPTAGDVLTASGTGEPDWAAPTTGAPSTADYLVGTAQAGLSAEIVVGATPGGELGGTWASPTVDATHSGSSHAGVISAHEASSFHPLNNLAASTAPAVTDDSGDGYSIGSIWIDTTADEAYIATDVSVGAAVWKRTTALPSGATITTQDEGGTLSTGVTTLDFVGAGVSAAGAGATTTITIPGGGGSLTLPTVVTPGASATGTGDVTPALPSGHTLNDILLLIVQSSNQTVAAPAGWTKLGPAAGFGTAAAAGSVRLTLFWKRHDGSESDPTVTDPGDHAIAQIIGFRGAVETGDPFLNMGTLRKTTASTTGTCPGGATPVDACLVVNIVGHALDSASAVFSSWTNADLANVTEQLDSATADGTGGGFGLATGEATTAQTFAGTTVTETSTTDVSLTLVLLPEGITSRAGFIDRQVFLTPGFADTWIKPTAAKVVTGFVVGGGASGSAGRNAATASGGGGGGGGAWEDKTFQAANLAATVTATAGAGGAATANADGSASNAGTASSFGAVVGNGGAAAAAAASGSGGAGGAGGGNTVIGNPAAGAVTEVYGTAIARGGTGGTTGAGGSANWDFGGGGGAGGGTTQAGTAGGVSGRGGAGGGGGRNHATNFGTGGATRLLAGGGTVGASGSDSPVPEASGGSGAAGGNSAAGPGGTGGWPGGGGGGGGSQSGAQRGGAGGDGVVVIVTDC